MTNVSVGNKWKGSSEGKLVVREGVERLLEWEQGSSLQ